MSRCRGNRASPGKDDRMPIRIARLEMPKHVARKDDGSEPNYGCYTAEPFEAGYGRTIGNSLRRVLLSSLEGASIYAVLIEGAPHEFCSLPGVVEDVTDIVLNLKKVLLRMYSRDPQRIHLHVEGPGEVTAGQIVCDSKVEILNKDFVIATLDTDGRLDMDIDVRIGRGYGPAAANGDGEGEIGRIPVDCLYSPVRRVRYDVEATRVGRRTDYDKLTLEIWTDGRISPNDALTTSAAILRRHLDVFVAYDEKLVLLDEAGQQDNAERAALRKKLAMSVNDIELSVRSSNCLNNANITTVGELTRKTESEMLKYRNFGRLSLQEIKRELERIGLSLGMTFDADLLSPPASGGERSARDGRRAE